MRFLFPLKMGVSAFFALVAAAEPQQPPVGNEAPTVGLVQRAQQLPGAVKVTLGFPGGKPSVLNATSDTTVEDYSPGVHGPRIDYFRLTEPKYIGKYAVASKDSAGRLIALTLSPPTQKVGDRPPPPPPTPPRAEFRQANVKVEKEEVPPVPPLTRVKLTTDATVSADAITFWLVMPIDKVYRTETMSATSCTVLVRADQGEQVYTYAWVAGEKGKPQQFEVGQFKAGQGPQPPPGPTPTPPGPTPPGPTPPGPTPQAGMIEAPGFHVLIKFDAYNTLRSADEHSILFSESDSSVRQYLKKNCPPVEGGLGFRFYPADAAGAGEPWLTPWKRGTGELPIATISKDGKGWEGSIAGWSPAKFIAKCEEIRKL